MAENGLQGKALQALHSLTSVTWLRRLGLFCLYQSAFYLSYKYSLEFSHAGSAAFWFPDSVVLCALLTSRPRYWGILLVSVLPERLLIEWQTHIPDWFRLTAFAIDSTKAVIVASGLRYLLSDPVRFRNAREYAYFCGLAVIGGPVLAAVASAATRQIAGVEFWPSWKEWFLSNVATQLIVTPPLFYWAMGEAETTWWTVWRRWREATLLLAGLMWSGLCAYHLTAKNGPFSDPLFYAPVPFLFWAAVRFGMPGASGAIGILSAFAIRAALHPQGLQAAHSLSSRNFLMLAAGYVYIVGILTEQKKGAEHSLSESETRFRLIADTAPVMIWTIDTRKLCDFVNRRWLELTGRTIEQELKTGWADGIHPEDRQRCLEVFNSHFDARLPFEMDYRYKRHDGQYRWIVDYGRPRYDKEGEFLGYIGSCIDMTERRRQESELRNSEERYREVVESQAEMVCRFLPNTVLTFVNEAFCRSLSRKRRDVIGKEFPELLPEASRELAARRIAEAQAMKTPCGWQCEITSPDGTSIWQQWMSYPIFGPGGALEEFQCIGVDITDRKRAEDLARLVTHAQEEERKRIGRELHDDLSQRTAAHVIALRNTKESIAEEGDTAIAIERLDKLEQQAMALGEGIRLVAHQLHAPSFTAEGLESALRTLCGEFGALTRMRVDLQCEGPTKDVPAQVMMCCFRVVQEGLRNVAKHARASEVKIRVATSPDRLWLELADDGIGMNGRNENYQGGLGLCSMRERVELLSGIFRISDRAPQGTVVTAVVPFGG